MSGECGAPPLRTTVSIGLVDVDFLARIMAGALG